MGNCQAIDAAALVIQHPSGKLERMYWSVSASEVMKMNPGHYVSLIIPLPNQDVENPDDKSVRFTRVKLLRSTDTLILGHAYRLVTTQDVIKVLKAKKYAKMKKNLESGVQTDMEKRNSSCQAEARSSELEKTSEVLRNEKHHQHRTGSTNISTTRSKSWRPSLQSITEATS